jgi:OmpA-OmpF porin, OOP family
MTSRLAPALAIATLLAGVAAPSEAQTAVQHLGAAPSAEELIRALKPGPGGAGIFATRGARPTSAIPGAPTRPDPPAVALDVKFALNSAELTDQARRLVRELATAINSRRLASDRFRLEGHTDSTGNPDDNLLLSKRRADAVRAYMVNSLGVAADRLESVGRGQDVPLDREHPESGINRRVQMVDIAAR